MRTTAEIMKDIEVKRSEMVRIGMQNGLDFTETIRVSQELDELLNEHARSAKIEKSGGFASVYHQCIG